jgi:1-acyl-sn-glycerol-3-phosphate acyltransferase
VLPPKLVRRLLLTPLMLVVTAVAVVLSPIEALLAALVSPFLGNWRPLRLLWISVSYLMRDALSTVAFFVLWLASGFGRFADSPPMRRAHYAVLGWFMGGLVNSGLRAVRSWVRVTEFSGAEEVLAERRRPVLVFSRHAGAGDSFLLVHELINRYGRRPRIVMKALLQWDPFIDLFGNRLPNCFVAGGGQELIDGIATLAEGLESGDALLIFPEGGNFTEDRRRRTIERLERDGHHDAAERARKMDNLMAPRPGGALAAIASAPDADVVFIAHTGLPDPRSTGDLLRLVPLDHPVELGMWHVPAAEIPADKEERIDWLFAWWCRLDSFIERQGGGRASSPAPAVTP